MALLLTISNVVYFLYLNFVWLKEITPFRFGRYWTKENYRLHMKWNYKKIYFSSKTMDIYISKESETMRKETPESPGTSYP